MAAARATVHLGKGADAFRFDGRMADVADPVRPPNHAVEGPLDALQSGGFPFTDLEGSAGAHEGGAAIRNLMPKGVC